MAVDLSVKKKTEEELATQNNNESTTSTNAYSQPMVDAMNKVLNREDFSYDVNNDALYQQYKNQYINNANLAMKDTLGQAQAMTGGYGNSYANTAAQAAYNTQMNNLNDKVPELYELAYNAYQNKTTDLLNNYNILANQENQAYTRDYQTQRDAVTDNLNERNFALTQDQWEYNKAAQDRAYKLDAYNAETNRISANKSSSGSSNNNPSISSIRSDAESVYNANGISAAINLLDIYTYDEETNPNGFLTVAQAEKILKTFATDAEIQQWINEQNITIVGSHYPSTKGVHSGQ